MIGTGIIGPSGIILLGASDHTTIFSQNPLLLLSLFLGGLVFMSFLLTRLLKTLIK